MCSWVCGWIRGCGCRAQHPQDYRSGKDLALQLDIVFGKGRAKRKKTKRNATKHRHTDTYPDAPPPNGHSALRCVEEGPPSRAKRIPPPKKGEKHSCRELASWRGGRGITSRLLKTCKCSSRLGLYTSFTARQTRISSVQRRRRRRRRSPCRFVAGSTPHKQATPLAPKGKEPNTA